MYFFKSIQIFIFSEFPMELLQLILETFLGFTWYFINMCFLTPWRSFWGFTHERLDLGNLTSKIGKFVTFIYIILYLLYLYLG